MIEEDEEFDLVRETKKKSTQAKVKQTSISYNSLRRKQMIIIGIVALVTIVVETVIIGTAVGAFLGY